MWNKDATFTSICPLKCDVFSWIPFKHYLLALSQLSSKITTVHSEGQVIRLDWALVWPCMATHDFITLAVSHQEACIQLAPRSIYHWSNLSWQQLYFKNIVKHSTVLQLGQTQNPMFIFIYISFQAEKYYHCPKEAKMLPQEYKNRNKNKTLKKNQGSCQKKIKNMMWERRASTKIKQIEWGVWLCPKPKSKGQESRESIEDAKERRDYLNCSITSLHKTSIILLLNSDFIALIASGFSNFNTAYPGQSWFRKNPEVRWHNQMCARGL